MAAISLVKDRLRDISLHLTNDKTLPELNDLAKETHAVNTSNLELSRYPFIHRAPKDCSLPVRQLQYA